METDERKCEINAKRLLKIGRNWETKREEVTGEPPHFFGRRPKKSGKPIKRRIGRTRRHM